MTSVKKPKTKNKTQAKVETKEAKGHKRSKSEEKRLLKTTKSQPNMIST